MDYDRLWRYLMYDVPDPESLVLAGRALRRLRRLAIREFEAIYRAVMLNQTMEDIALWLNDRAIRNEIPIPTGKVSHYTVRDATVLVESGAEKMRDWIVQMDDRPVGGGSGSSGGTTGNR